MRPPRLTGGLISSGFCLNGHGGMIAVRKDDKKGAVSQKKDIIVIIALARDLDVGQRKMFNILIDIKLRDSSPSARGTGRLFALVLACQRTEV